MSRLAMQDAIEDEPWRMDAGLIHTNTKSNTGPAPSRYQKHGEYHNDTPLFIRVKIQRGRAEEYSPE